MRESRSKLTARCVGATTSATTLYLGASRCSVAEEFLKVGGIFWGFWSEVEDVDYVTWGHVAKSQAFIWTAEIESRALWLSRGPSV